MTALEKYQRLECAGLWRNEDGGQRREVLVALGDATLVISDPKSDQALAHWSLPAVERINPGLVPARFAPGADAVEELEIDDGEMVAALSKVHALIEARRPHPGRLRSVLLIGGLALIAAAGFFWIPGAIIGQASRMVPDEVRDRIGQLLMTDVFRVTGAACTAPEGRAALGRLGERLFGAGRGNLIVLATGLEGTRHLPGGAIMIGRGLVENSKEPEALAGYVLAEAARMDERDPLADLLDWAGTRAAVGLLTTGTLNEERLVGYAEWLLSQPEPRPQTDDLVLRFVAAQVDPRPYAESADLPAKERTDLIDNAAPDTTPVMSDTDWVALQGICAG